jgi:hypothetical protein
VSTHEDIDVRLAACAIFHATAAVLEPLKVAASTLDAWSYLQVSICSTCSMGFAVQQPLSRPVCPFIMQTATWANSTSRMTSR